MDMKSALIYYSHSDYSDIWPLMFGQTDKYFSKDVKKYLFIDKKVNVEKKGWFIINYEDNELYQNRVAFCLKQVKEDLVLFNHEDMILYDKPDFKELEKIEKYILDNKSNIVKLIKSEIEPNSSIKMKENGFYLNEKNCYFSIQPSICKKEKLLQIYENTLGNNIWNFEINSSKYAIRNQIKSMHYFLGTEKKIGQFHWESKIFPYMATAIVKGKWNMLEYKKELNLMLDEYKIDCTIRGTNEIVYI